MTFNKDTWAAALDAAEESMTLDICCLYLRFARENGIVPLKATVAQQAPFLRLAVAPLCDGDANPDEMAEVLNGKTPSLAGSFCWALFHGMSPAVFRQLIDSRGTQAPKDLGDWGSLKALLQLFEVEGPGDATDMWQLDDVALALFEANDAQVARLKTAVPDSLWDLVEEEKRFIGQVKPAHSQAALDRLGLEGL